MFSLEQVISPLEMRYVAISLWAKFHFTSVAFFFPPSLPSKENSENCLLSAKSWFYLLVCFF